MHRINIEEFCRDRGFLYHKNGSDLVATDNSDEVCGTIYLSPDDALLIPFGGYKQGTVDDASRWVEKGELTACDAEGKELKQMLRRSMQSSLWIRPSPRRSFSTTTGRQSINLLMPSSLLQWATTSTSSSSAIAEAPTTTMATSSIPLGACSSLPATSRTHLRLPLRHG